MIYYKSVSKACSILRMFNPQTPELTVAQIAMKIGMHRASIHRMLATLCKSGFLEKDKNTDKYRIGPELYILGGLYLDTADVVKVARPVLETLNDLTNEAINFSILDLKSGHSIVIMRQEAKYSYRWAARIGTTIPAYTSSQGKALLSALDDKEIDSLYPEENLKPMTSKTITTKSELKKELAKIRNTGVAFNIEGTYEGIEGVASAIRNAEGQVVAALGVAVPIFRMNRHKRKRLGELVRAGASLISYRLGYVNKDYRFYSEQDLYSLWEPDGNAHKG
jgi:DNA-binding IclR family transcriptional regulator